MNISDTVPHQIILWVIWFAFLSGLPFFVVFLGPDPDRAVENVLPFPALLAVIPPFLASVIVRWLVLPKVAKQGPEAQLVILVVGMALAESLVFFGIFLFPADSLLFIVFAVIGMAQFVPLWALPKRDQGSGLRA
ncbi:MAG: hypothetical protein JJT75_06000 [Opitutales bacterium]|nr:hypothetical protein [Opitutales bacterium]MCH8540709.1 hypothetical protein [Opitutales bacterium]